MEAKKVKIGLVMLLSLAAVEATNIDCATVTAFLSACSTFISYGSPDPLPGSPCCESMTSLNLIAQSGDNKRSVCRCFMGLIAAYNPFATTIATLPGFCGISLGFIVGPNADCTT
ncbi:hypothetical protein JCGZ_26145 [Jatropha curcas]|uniref:Bifunctional inhibitor/plant lipid transfer protein/seed storage helical domain-containing protein n=2 Tax=Jatropha curcas TaxID=180498 RepID=A0A067JS02_JATCU|nr:hypothetical protein JCGZ_26145 [Jatropha curcas]